MKNQISGTCRQIYQLGQRLWRDCAGFIEAGNYILITTLLCIGILAGLVTFRDQLVQEFGDIADALECLDQSYSFAIVSPLDQNVIITSTDFDEDNPVDDQDPPAPVPPVVYGPATPEAPGGQAPAGIQFTPPDQE